MASPRWSRITELFHQAVDLDADDRSGFLKDACDGDEELRREVESLLSGDAKELPESGQGRSGDPLHDVLERALSDDTAEKPELWAEAKQVFSEAVDGDPAAREQVIRNGYGNEEELQQQLRSPLAGAGDTFRFPEDRRKRPGVDGRQIGNYIITGEIGRGGMGIVYRARHVALPRDVVLKCIRPVLVSKNAHNEMQARFRREAYIQSQLDHRNIVRVYEFFTEGDAYFLVMEYVRGSTLRAILDDHGSLPVVQVVEVAIQALDALAYAHALQFVDETGSTGVGVIHRDLKPPNLLIDKNGNLKITDYGIAKLLGQHRTETELSPGTAEYMSPEQVRGHPVDVRSDLYSLGVTLYEAVVGRVPFPRTVSNSDYDVLMAHVDIEPPAIRTLNPDVPPALADVIERALRKDPNNRWQSAQDFLEAVAALRDSRVTTHSHRNQRSWTRWPRRLALSTRPMLAPAVPSEDLASQSLIPDSQKHPPPEVSRRDSCSGPNVPPRDRYHYLRHGRLLWIAGAMAMIAGTVAFWVFQRSITARPLADLRAGEQNVRVRPVAIATGTEMMPTFSPDGTRVAYVWDGGQDEEEPDIRANVYVKQLDAETTVQLTRGNFDFFPQWSPDGRFISFYRSPEILVIPAIGGRELKLGEVRWGRIGPIQTWTADSSGVIAADRRSSVGTSPLWFLPLDSSAKFRVTEPPSGFADLTPSVSPDGRTLAFTRNSASLSNNIFLLPIDGHRPVGALRQLTFSESATYFYLTWAQDGKSLFCLRMRPDPAVLRIPVSEGKPVQVIPQILPNQMNFLAAAPRGNKLAWSTAIYDMDIWRAEISPTPLSQHSVRARVAHTTRPEHEPALSPDGSMLAFASGRGGTTQLWLSDADGRNATVFDVRKSHYPNWSPDSKEIAYEVYDRDGVDVYVKPVRDGASRLITDVPSDALRPVWSRDGRWIYFSWDGTGTRNIWKIPATGGEMKQVTENGGFRAAESVDRQTLYFTTEESETSVWSMPINGGKPSKIIWPLYSGDAFQVLKDGIYAVVRKDLSGSPNSLVFYSFASRQTRAVATLDIHFERAISVSADGQWLFYDALRYRSGDLMMIEGLP